MRAAGIAALLAVVFAVAGVGVGFAVEGSGSGEAVGAGAAGVDPGASPGGDVQDGVGHGGDSGSSGDDNGSGGSGGNGGIDGSSGEAGGSGEEGAMGQGGAGAEKEGQDDEAGLSKKITDGPVAEAALPAEAEASFSATAAGAAAGQGFSSYVNIVDLPDDGSSGSASPRLAAGIDWSRDGVARGGWATYTAALSLNGLHGGDYVGETHLDLGMTGEWGNSRAVNLGFGLFERDEDVPITVSDTAPFIDGLAPVEGKSVTVGDYAEIGVIVHSASAYGYFPIYTQQITGLEGYTLASGTPSPFLTPGGAGSVAWIRDGGGFLGEGLDHIVAQVNCAAFNNDFRGVDISLSQGGDPNGLKLSGWIAEKVGGAPGAAETVFAADSQIRVELAMTIRAKVTGDAFVAGPAQGGFTPFLIGSTNGVQPAAQIAPQGDIPPYADLFSYGEGAQTGALANSYTGRVFVKCVDAAGEPMKDGSAGFLLVDKTVGSPTNGKYLAGVGADGAAFVEEAVEAEMYGIDSASYPEVPGFVAFPDGLDPNMVFGLVQVSVAQGYRLLSEIPLVSPMGGEWDDPGVVSATTTVINVPTPLIPNTGGIGLARWLCISLAMFGFGVFMLARSRGVTVRSLRGMSAGGVLRGMGELIRHPLRSARRAAGDEADGGAGGAGDTSQARKAVEGARFVLVAVLAGVCVVCYIAASI